MSVSMSMKTCVCAGAIPYKAGVHSGSGCVNADRTKWVHLVANSSVKLHTVMWLNLGHSLYDSRKIGLSSLGPG